MRVTLCDNCRNNVNPQIDPNYIGHTMSIDIPEDFKYFRDENQRIYDFCSPECRRKWETLSSFSTEQLADEIAKREAVDDVNVRKQGDRTLINVSWSTHLSGNNGIGGVGTRYSSEAPARILVIKDGSERE